MAESDRVAGIYSEVQYRFDPKSIKTLRKFKRDLMEVKDNIRAIKRLSKGNVKLGFSAKQAKVSQQVQRATEKTNKASSEQVEKSAKVWRMKEKILKNQAREARLQQQASQREVSRVGKVYKQRQKIEQAQSQQSQREVDRAAKVWRMRQRITKEHLRQAKITANAKKQEMAMEAKIAAQRAKMARMGGMGMSSGRITPSSLNRIKQAQERLNRAYRDGSISVSQFNTQSQRLTGILQRQSRTVQKTRMSFDQMRTAIAGATGAFSGFAAAGSVKQIGGQFEDAAIMLETAFGSQSEAQDVMSFLIEQSQRLGVGATEVSKGFARYALAGKRMGFTNEQLREQFLGVAEASVVFGLTQQEITGTIRA